MNGAPFEAALEPDGRDSRWFQVEDELRQRARAKVGQTVDVEIEPTKEWPEPNVPSDLDAALEADDAARATWVDITPAARWDWIRWVGSTRNPATREKHVIVACSKLAKGMRRPCCFNRNQCTLTQA